VPVGPAGGAPSGVVERPPKAGLAGVVVGTDAAGDDAPKSDFPAPANKPPGAAAGAAVGVCDAAAPKRPPEPNAGVEDAAGVAAAAPPNKPPGAAAAVGPAAGAVAPPPKSPPPDVAVLFAPPKRPPPPPLAAD